MSDNLSGIINDNTHYFPKRVYYSDTDAGGVVYHSRYIDMAEHGRSELIRLLGGDQKSLLDESGLAFVVRSLNVSYNRPAFLDDMLSVRTRLSKCENFTLIFDQKIYRDNELLTELEVKIGCISLGDGKPKPMPREWKQVIEEKMMS
ncbi:YbgC/FadM family acyl-CoA thioesterase [Oceanispirochaeta sp.]|jgi:acyl-CoA thioester hydrolase|uniref:YbgC/FadM family acyl-CoA thioesterase n=1 Tax=Oceanispirochaeta sp. TaxID=2035350 RepID=UPI00261BF5B2|nr:YbgC/FadM family acyl-CoA thioesterase [Oceanispirochaeta sp.]MDA3957391.1 YbgC/FadM family acyl-CoA thioesterase [Oceanispirochaeta sp.]